MIKNGNMALGKTPSVQSGKPATHIVRGEPLADGERFPDPGLRKMASLLNGRSPKPKKGSHV